MLGCCSGLNLFWFNRRRRNSICANLVSSEKREVMKIHYQHSIPSWTLLLLFVMLSACSSASSSSSSSSSASLFGRDVIDTLLNENGYVKIKPGNFMMGTSDEEEAEEEEGLGQGERPQHRVIITKEFEMGKYEVTQKQW